MAIIVRPAVEQDRDIVLNLMREYIVDFYGATDPGREKVEGLFSRLLEGGIGTQFLAEKDGECIGFATLYFTWSTLRAQPVLVLNDLYLVEAARGTGAGRQLFEACTAYGRNHGYAAMTWETAAENSRAQAFYERMGGTRGTWVAYSLEL